MWRKSLKQIIFFLFLLCFLGCSQEQYSIWPDGNIPCVISGDFTSQSGERSNNRINEFLYYIIKSKNKFCFY